MCLRRLAVTVLLAAFAVREVFSGKAGHDFRCPLAEGLFQDPFDCSAFYQCSSWTAYRFQCPAGLLFSEEAERCDWPEFVNCVPHEVTTTDGTQPNNTDGPLSTTASSYTGDISSVTPDHSHNGSSTSSTRQSSVTTFVSTTGSTAEPFTGYTHQREITDEPTTAASADDPDAGIRSTTRQSSDGPNEWGTTSETRFDVPKSTANELSTIDVNERSTSINTAPASHDALDVSTTTDAPTRNVNIITASTAEASYTTSAADNGASTAAEAHKKVDVSTAAPSWDRSETHETPTHVFDVVTRSTLFETDGTSVRATQELEPTTPPFDDSLGVNPRGHLVDVNQSDVFYWHLWRYGDMLPHNWFRTSQRIVENTPTWVSATFMALVRVIHDDTPHFGSMEVSNLRTYGAIYYPHQGVAIQKYSGTAQILCIKDGMRERAAWKRVNCNQELPAGTLSSDGLVLAREILRRPTRIRAVGAVKPKAWLKTAHGKELMEFPLYDILVKRSPRH